VRKCNCLCRWRRVQPFAQGSSRVCLGRRVSCTILRVDFLNWLEFIHAHVLSVHMAAQIFPPCWESHDPTKHWNKFPLDFEPLCTWINRFLMGICCCSKNDLKWAKISSWTQVYRSTLCPHRTMSPLLWYVQIWCVCEFCGTQLDIYLLSCSLSPFPLCP